MGYQTLIYEATDGMGVITLNRPQALNAINRSMIEELAKVVDQAEKDSLVRVLIVTGAGEKAFAAGADVAELQYLTPTQAQQVSEAFQAVFNKIEGLKKPVIAAVNGLALGAACELVLACDIIFASDRARLGQPEINLGFIPGAGGTQRLPRLIGKTRAKELIFTGEMINAQEAHRIGLVNRVIPAVELMTEVRRFAQKVVSKGALALEFAKRAIEEGFDLNLRAALALESKAFASCFGTEDGKEGIAAFLEKRQPQFKGR